MQAINKLRKRAIKRNRFGENGQTLTEYIILVILVALVSMPIFKMLPKAVAGYTQPFYYSVSRPLP